MFAAANQCFKSLEYVYPIRHPWASNWTSSASQNCRSDPCSDGAPDDLMLIHFKNEDWRTGELELKHCSAAALHNCLSSRLQPIIRAEPVIPFRATALTEFRFSGFTHVVVAHSPLFAPPRADGLLPSLRQYFRPS